MIGRGQDGKVHLELDLTETEHLFSILMHAKFSETVDLRIVGAPTMRALLDALFVAFPAAGGAGWQNPREGNWIIDETDSDLRAPASFEIIESLLTAEGWGDNLEDSVFPFRWIARSPRDRFIERGRIVVLAGDGPSSPRVGICVHGWRDEVSYDAFAQIAWVTEVEDGPVDGVDFTTHAVTELRVVR